MTKESASAEPSVSIEELKRYFDENEVHDKCPQCSNESWLVLLNTLGENWALAGSIGGPSDSKPGANLEVFVFCCTKCSFVRMHAKEFISEWLEENPADEGPAE
jgi:hypothetical protein